MHGLPHGACVRQELRACMPGVPPEPARAGRYQRSSPLSLSELPRPSRRQGVCRGPLCPLPRLHLERSPEHEGALCRLPYSASAPAIGALGTSQRGGVHQLSPRGGKRLGPARRRDRMHTLPPAPSFHRQPTGDPSLRRLPLTAILRNRPTSGTPAVRRVPPAGRAPSRRRAASLRAMSWAGGVHRAGRTPTMRRMSPAPRRRADITRADVCGVPRCRGPEPSRPERRRVHPLSPCPWAARRRATASLSELPCRGPTRGASRDTRASRMRSVSLSARARAVERPSDLRPVPPPHRCRTPPAGGQALQRLSRIRMSRMRSSDAAATCQAHFCVDHTAADSPSLRTNGRGLGGLSWVLCGPRSP
jgi:hypothetical protein